MNLLFQTAKPRRFRHTLVYIDERRERLRKLEAQARRELGMEPDARPDNRLCSDNHLRSGVQPLAEWSGADLRPDLKLGIHRGKTARQRSLVPFMAIVSLLLVIILACLLPWL